jgi:hypothetical protein
MLAGGPLASPRLHCRCRFVAGGLKIVYDAKLPLMFRQATEAKHRGVMSNGLSR